MYECCMSVWVDTRNGGETKDEKLMKHVNTLIVKRKANEGQGKDEEVDEKRNF